MAGKGTVRIHYLEQITSVAQSLTAGEIRSKVLKDLKINPNMARFFMLRCQKDGSYYYVERDRPLLPSEIASSYPIVLRIRAWPPSMFETVRGDVNMCTFIKRQVHQGVLDGSLPLDSIPTIVRLAAIFLVSEGREESSKHVQSDASIAKFLDQYSLFKLVPTVALTLQPRDQTRDQILRACSPLLKMSEKELLLSYVDVALRLGDAFNEEMVAKISNKGGVGTTQGAVVISPVRGLLFRPSASDEFLVCDFSHIQQITIAQGRLDLSIMGRGNIESLVLPSAEATVSLALLLDEYAMIAQKTDTSFLKHEFRASTIRSVGGQVREGEADLDACYGKIDRWETEGILSANGCGDGLYLLRKSTSDPNAYGLSVCYQGAINHYKVDRFANGKFGIQDGLRYYTIKELLRHYHTEVDGLCCRLQLNVATLDKSGTPRMATLPLASAPLVEDSPPKVPPRSNTLPKGASLTSYSDVSLSSPSPSAPPKGPKMTLSDYEIPREQLTMGDELGSGEFGTVVAGQWRAKGQPPLPVAMKVLKGNSADQEQRRAFLAEANSMVAINHPNVVRMLGVCTTAPMTLVCELVPLGSLNKYLRKEADILGVKQLTNFLIQIATGMEYLESMNIVHRDLAARNVLVASISLVKISDFGLSRSVSQSDYYTSTARGKWPIKWYAPECIFFMKFTHKSDVWSFGVTAWEVMSYGKKPYKGLTGKQVVQLLEEGGRLPKPSDTCPDPIYEIMAECWQEDKETRPSFTQLKIHLSKILDALEGKGGSLQRKESIYRSLLDKQQVFYDMEANEEERAVDEIEEVEDRDDAQMGAVLSSPASIPFSSLRLGEILGEGAFGTVHKGVYVAPNGAMENVAIKMLKSGDFKQDEFIREAEIMASLSHPHLVRAFGCSYSNGSLMLVAELCLLGPLNTYLKTSRPPAASLFRFIAQIASAMAFMEEKRFIHRDLAARNVLVSSPSLCKVGDFGLSRALGSGSEYYRSQQKGKWPIKWYAPECLFESKFTHKSDVWSFGVTVWEILSYGEKPYKGLNGRDVIKVLERKETLKVPQGFPQWCGDLLADCFLWTSDARPSFADVLELCARHQPA